MSAEVTVVLPDLLREIVGTTRFRVRAATLQSAFREMRARHPLLEDHLFQGDDFRPHVLCLVNGENTAERDPAKLRLRAGDTISFLQAISGG